MHARVALALAVAAALLQSCAETRSPLDETWGLSVRMAVESQKLDPSPPSALAVTGLDGDYAKNALDAYRKSAGSDDAKSSAVKSSPVELMLSTKGGT